MSQNQMNANQSSDILRCMQGGLVASCQPVDDGPMDRPDLVAAMAMAAVVGGAAALRIEGVDNLRAVRPHVNVPIIGIVKSDTEGTPVRITVTEEDALALIAAGADVVAYDATSRPRQDSPEQVLAAILGAGAIAMADCSTLEDAIRAQKSGATILGSTLSGYTTETATDETGPAYELITQISELGAFVMAEGRVNTPKQAERAMMHGANAVTVGTALTRLEFVTAGFAQAIAKASEPRGPTGFAIDLGGTKTAAARIENGEVVKQVQRSTDGTSKIAAHIDLMADLLSEVGYVQGSRLGVVVTGRVNKDGHWFAINTETISGISTVPLKNLLTAKFGEVLLENDAAAATLAEYELGSGNGTADFAYITVSTGVAGGVILDGKIHKSPDGFAGHFGFAGTRASDIACGSGRIGTVESIASGTAIANLAAQAGYTGMDARQVAQLAREGVTWADEIMNTSAKSIAELAADLRSILGIQRIAIGGGVGLSEGYVERVRQHISNLPTLFAVEIVPATLGTDAPLLGALISSERE